jgi:hypothetical protein
LLRPPLRRAVLLGDERADLLGALLVGVSDGFEQGGPVRGCAGPPARQGRPRGLYGGVDIYLIAGGTDSVVCSVAGLTRSIVRPE